MPFGAICQTCQTCFQASYPLGEGLKTRDYAVCGAEWGARLLLQPVRDVAFLAAFAMFRHVLKIPRKGSIVVPCVALHCLYQKPANLLGICITNQISLPFIGG